MVAWPVPDSRFGTRDETRDGDGFLGQHGVFLVIFGMFRSPTEERSGDGSQIVGLYMYDELHDCLPCRFGAHLYIFQVQPGHRHDVRDFLAAGHCKRRSFAFPSLLPLGWLLGQAGLPQHPHQWRTGKV